MRLVTFVVENEHRLGVLQGDLIIDLQQAYLLWRDHQTELHDQSESTEYFTNDMLTLLRRGETALDIARSAINFIQHYKGLNEPAQSSARLQYQMDEVTFCPPILEPRKIVCVGMNYPMPGSPATAIPAYPVLFLKSASTLTGHQQPILLPRISRQVFCEGELAIVIGARGKHIPPENVHAHIAGYTIANDVGAKDLEQRSSQWATGKLPDTFCPMGPILMTREEVLTPGNLKIKTYINQQLILSGNTKDMLFDIPYLISYISDLATLESGDIILTGSPKGVENRPSSLRFLRAGELVSVEIEAIGILENPTLAEEVFDE